MIAPSSATKMASMHVIKLYRNVTQWSDILRRGRWPLVGDDDDDDDGCVGRCVS